MEKFTGIRIKGAERNLSRAILECIKCMKKINSISKITQRTYSLNDIAVILIANKIVAVYVKTEIRTTALKGYNVVPVFDANKLYHLEGEAGALYPFYSVPKKTLVIIEMFDDKPILIEGTAIICAVITGKDSNGYKAMFYYNKAHWEVSGIKLVRSLTPEGKARTNLQCNQSTLNPVFLTLPCHVKLRQLLASETGFVL